MANILHGGAEAGEQPDLPHGRGAAGAPGDAGAAARGRKGARAAGREVNGARAMASAQVRQRCLTRRVEYLLRWRSEEDRKVVGCVFYEYFFFFTDLDSFC